MERCITDKTREVIQAVYLQVKPYKGFKGYWRQDYLFADMIDTSSKLITNSFILHDCKCIKGQGFKRGDVIQMMVTLEPDKKGNVKVSRPANVIKVGHDADYD